MPSTKTLTYVVVRNDEGHYSLWDSERQVPLGWHVQTQAASREECLEFIRNAWIDMRPLGGDLEQRAQTDLGDTKGPQGIHAA